MIWRNYSNQEYNSLNKKKAESMIVEFRITIRMLQTNSTNKNPKNKKLRKKDRWSNITISIQIKIKSVKITIKFQTVKIGQLMKISLILQIKTTRSKNQQKLPKSNPTKVQKNLKMDPKEKPSLIWLFPKIRNSIFPAPSIAITIQKKIRNKIKSLPKNKRCQKKLQIWKRLFASSNWKESSTKPSSNKYKWKIVKP